ncbi:MAG: hypothetical protein KatS3mg068_1926 [Candidatus Sericytochromatia bacterium]|nr:MAG: hypothetical protein KatS3mg068_1926 [Candidatus Sericytochromatia bacterium]
MSNKKNDFFKQFESLDFLNISKVLKQIENLKLSGFFEKIEEFNKLMKQIEDIKLSDMIKKIEDIRLSNIVKEIEEKNILEAIKNLQNFFLDNVEENLSDIKGVKNITINNKVDSIPEQIKKLHELKNLGIITNEEFQIKKKKLLDRI